ncbi:hypothetical protein PG994_007315 [Apiospora phragmitis]|uniref:RNA-dependent RNA polymerase n=1 Tax=Apiospora phragmitis TaxID=2905665 RepID=A0ABR1V0H9_9PEZI
MVTSLPSASSEQERCDLVELLYKVLGRYVVGRTPISSFNSKFEDYAPSDLASKRARSSSNTSGNPVHDPEGEVVEQPAEITECANPLKRTSAHSSRDSCRTADLVFSQEPPLSQATQTTVEANSFAAYSDFEHKLLKSFVQEQAAPAEAEAHSVNEPSCVPESDSSDLYFSEIGQSTLAELDGVSRAQGATIAFEKCLNVWLVVPDCLNKAPLPIVWEVLRVCLFAGVPTRDIQLSYEESWLDQDVLWKMLVFTLQLDPLRPHKLNRRFGQDRFMELIIPTLDAKNLPSHIKNIAIAESTLRHWASQRLHYFMRRIWSGFFIRPYRHNSTKEAVKDQKDLFNPVHHVSSKHRFYLFAEDGDDFVPSVPGQLPPKGEPFKAHTRATKGDMIEWLLQISQNMDQPVTKLFLRIVLGLSRMDATVVLEKSQIKIRKRDRLSPTGNVMNDGIDRISQSLARKIRTMMGSSGNLTGFQGRIGNWIILYPSQRKWKCDFIEEHRTFEVRSEVSPLKSANLNNQFLPILQDRAKGKNAMKKVIGDVLERSLCKEMEEQRMAIQDPCRLRLWVQNNSTSSLREARLRNGQVPFVGGLPKQDEDRINFLIDRGFDPRRLRMLWDLIFKLRRDKCEEMKSRMNIRIGRSAYAFMVGLLNEGEIYLEFSSNFQDDESSFSETHLHGIDVLVARSPAHYTSDIQKVRAVFRPELGPLKDVVVFPSKGNVPLADKLSGGDYDGDIAWVCWDPDIVGNFVNADVPECPDLFKEGGVLTKQTESYSDLVLQHGPEASSKFFDASFQFNMQSSLLGLCTNFKERLGYERRSVGDEAAVRLSTLLSNLVGQAKQGIQFTNEDWAKFRNALLKGKPEPSQPRYKSDSCPGARKFSHIIDHLKFSVLIPIFERELATLHEEGKKTSLLVPWDKDLVKLYDLYNELGQDKPRVKSMMTKLVNDLDALYSQCMGTQARWKDVPFETRMERLHEDLCAIQPKKLTGTLERALTRDGTGQYSEWSLLKASVMFKKFYMQNVTWWIAGRQLQFLKSIETTKGTPTGGALALVRPQLYAALRPDKAYIQALALEDVVQPGGDVEEVEDIIDNANEI